MLKSFVIFVFNLFKRGKSKVQKNFCHVILTKDSTTCKTRSLGGPPGPRLLVHPDGPPDRTPNRPQDRPPDGPPDGHLDGPFSNLTPSLFSKRSSWLNYRGLHHCTLGFHITFKGKNNFFSPNNIATSIFI